MGVLQTLEANLMITAMSARPTLSQITPAVTAKLAQHAPANGSTRLALQRKILSAMIAPFAISGRVPFLLVVVLVTRFVTHAQSVRLIASLEEPARLVLLHAVKELTKLQLAPLVLIEFAHNATKGHTRPARWPQQVHARRAHHHAPQDKGLSMAQHIIPSQRRAAVLLSSDQLLTTSVSHADYLLTHLALTELAKHARHAIAHISL